MKLNDALPKITIDLEAYAVIADGELPTCEPAKHDELFILAPHVIALVNLLKDCVLKFTKHALTLTPIK